MQIQSSFTANALLSSHSDKNKLPYNPSATTENDGVAIGQGQHIMHLARLEQPETSTRQIQVPQLKTELMSVEEMMQYWQENGQKRDTTAIAYIDGEPAMMVGKHITTRNQYSDIALNSNGDVQKALAALQQQYGSRVEIKYFTDNDAPTNAEAFELFNNKPYAEFVTEQVQSMLSDRSEAERLRFAQEQRQLAWDNTPVDAVFKVNGKVIASVASETADFHTNTFLSALDELGLNRSEAQSFLNDTVGKSTSVNAVEAMLAKTFGTNLSSEFLSGDARPTRKAVSTLARAQAGFAD